LTIWPSSRGEREKGEKIARSQIRSASSFRRDWKKGGKGEKKEGKAMEHSFLERQQKLTGEARSPSFVSVRRRKKRKKEKERPAGAEP